MLVDSLIDVIFVADKDIAQVHYYFLFLSLFPVLENVCVST